MPERAYENVQVSVRLTPAKDAYEVGAIVEGAFLPFGRYNVGGFEDDLAEAREAAAAAAAAQPADGTAGAPQTAQLPPQ